MTILGLKSLHQKLEKMKRLAKLKVRLAMEESADEIVRMAKGLAPVDSGALRDSIGWTWGAAPSGSMTLTTLARSGESDLRITIYAGTRDKKLGDADAFYASWVEFGTQHMQAHPFFFPAYRANKKRARSRISRAINKAVKEAAGS